MGAIRKLVSFIFFVISLATLIGMTFMLSELLTSFNVSITIEEFLAMIGDSTIKEVMYSFSLLMYGIFTILGVPIIVSLLSLIGMTVKSK